MSHTKPALASDPATDFASTGSADDAPLDLTLLRQHDQGSSLMDRAQRRLATSDAIFARAHALREQAATSALPQEAQLATLDRQSQQLADAERTQSGYRRLRERYDPDELDLNLKAISAIADPIDQRLQLTQLRSRYAPFALSPELAQRIDAQFDTVEPVVQRKEEALAFTSTMSGRYAPTLAEARRAFPGRQIHTLATPGGGAPLFVPSDRPDPYQQAEALQLIWNARAYAEHTGDTARLDALLDDPTVRDVARVPGNLASEAYREALQATRPGPTQASPNPQTATAVPHSGIPHGATFNTPFGPGTVASRPPGGQPSATRNIPDWLVRLFTPDTHPELAKIDEFLAKRGRYFDPSSLQGRPRLSGASDRWVPHKLVTEFEEPGWKTLLDGATYAALKSASQPSAPPEGGTSLDGVYKASPQRNVRRAAGAGAALDLANAGVAGQLQAQNTLRRYAFFQNPRDGTWFVKDISAGYEKGVMLGEAQAKDIIKGIFENRGRRPPDLVTAAGSAPQAGRRISQSSASQPAAAPSLPPPAPSAAGSPASAIDGAREPHAGADERSPSREPARQEARAPESTVRTETPNSARTNQMSPFALGFEWLSGQGPRHRLFTEGDKVTTQIQSSPEVEDARRAMAERLAHGVFDEYSFGRKANREGKLDYAKGFVGDLFDNPARAFLGSFGAQAKVVNVQGNEAVVMYKITNSSGLESASRMPPPYGYDKPRSDGSPRPTLSEMLLAQDLGNIGEWRDLIPRAILHNNAFDFFGRPGPGSTNSQAIIWFETVHLGGTRE